MIELSSDLSAIKYSMSRNAAVSEMIMTPAIIKIGGPSNLALEYESIHNQKE